MLTRSPDPRNQQGCDWNRLEGQDEAEPAHRALLLLKAGASWGQTSLRGRPRRLKQGLPGRTDLKAAAAGTAPPRPSAPGSEVRWGPDGGIITGQPRPSIGQGVALQCGHLLGHRPSAAWPETPSQCWRPGENPGRPGEGSQHRQCRKAQSPVPAGVGHMGFCQGSGQPGPVEEADARPGG